GPPRPWVLIAFTRIPPSLSFSHRTLGIACVEVATSSSGVSTATRKHLKTAFRRWPITPHNEPHPAVFVRRRRKSIGKFPSLYIVSLKKGHWGVHGRSSFSP